MPTSLPDARLADFVVDRALAPRRGLRAGFALGLAFLGAASLSAQTTTRYEAESASLSGCSTASSKSGYSGSGYVEAGSFNNPDTITFTVNAAAAGSHTLRFRYHGGNGQKYQDVQVNSGTYAYTEFPSFSGWTNKELTGVSLNAGTNTVRVRANWGWTDFDYLEVVGGSSSGGGTGSADDITSQSWPSTVAASGPVSVTVNYTVTTGRRLRLTIWDSAWGWKGSTTTNVSANGSNTLSVASYSAITTGAANLRVELQSSDGATTYDTINQYNIPVGGGGGGGGGAYNRVRKNVGTNFWFVYHDETTSGFTGGYVFQNGVNFSTSSNPWNTSFLDEIKPYQVLRFMDWFGGNGDGQTSWADHRTRKGEPIQRGGTMGPVVSGYNTDIAPANQGNGRNTTGVAVEWLIDLCNRNQSDMWINIPYRTMKASDFPNGDDFNNEYVHKLAILLKHGVDMRAVGLKSWVGGKGLLNTLANKSKQEFINAGGVDTGFALNSALKIYVEYSNELWCCSRPQVKWVDEQGTALGFSNKRLFGAWAEVRVFKAFQDVFGASAMNGSRVWRVAGPTHKEAVNVQSFQGYFDSVYRNTAANRNPWWNNGGTGSVKPDAWKWAAYVGGDGSESSWNGDVNTERQDAINLRNVMSTNFGITKLFAYEGGQHLASNAGPFSHNSTSYTRYKYWLGQVDDGYDLILHYSHYGKWQSSTSTAGYGSWGAKSEVGQATSSAHKYRAIKDYIDGS